MPAILRYLSPLGPMVLAAEAGALTGAWFEGQKHCPALPGAAPGADPALAAAARWLDVYFAGGRPGDPPPLRAAGTDFQRQVWALLRAVPYGQTVTYGALAARLAAARGLEHMSARAVGGAVGRNPISILVPCHRVVGAGGALGGYAGGIARKQALLALEAAGRIK